MDITPQIPTELVSGRIKNELLAIAEKIVIQSAKIEGSHNKIVLDALKDILRNVNSYYSNQIESEGTHPFDTEKAIRKEYSKDDKKKRLQMLSIAHIKTQEFIEQKIITEKTQLSKEFIKDIHKVFYTQEEMESFCVIKFKDEIIQMIPGEIRNRDVKVGIHVVPPYDEVEYLLNMFETMYKLPKYMTKSEMLIYVLSSHHRLVWIHPFLDGNGRVSRLFLDAFLYNIEIEGYGLWNISRGLSRCKDDYKNALENADETRISERDGRGYLSNKRLEEFVRFMLEIILDQIEYMADCLKLNTLAIRIENYCKSANQTFLGIHPLPEGSEKIFKALLIKGEIERGEVQDIIGKKKTVTSATIKELQKRYYLISDGPRKPLRLNFNAHFASSLFPELIPPEIK